MNSSNPVKLKTSGIGYFAKVRPFVWSGYPVETESVSDAGPQKNYEFKKLSKICPELSFYGFRSPIYRKTN